jgi:threonine dehydrogenase-like Zn-dependent dehydrogenase
MIGLWLEDGRLRLRDDIPEPEPGPKEVLVRVSLAGICSTDHQLVDGIYPFTGVPGHEFVGVVESGSPELAGRRVVGEINAPCRDCPTCRAGRGKHCPDRTVLGIDGRHGAFAGHLVLPAANLHLVPDTVPDEAAVFAEPLAAAVEFHDRVDTGPSVQALVVGAGKLGWLVAEALKESGCRTSVATRESDFPPGFDLAVECTGNAQGYAAARRAVRPGGTLVLKSTYRGELTLDPTRLVVDEIQVVGSRCGPLDKALDLLSSGRIDPSPLLTRRFPLARGEEAFRFSREAGVRKVLLG